MAETRPSVAEEMVRQSTSFYQNRLAATVRALRDLADRVEQDGQPRDEPSPAGVPRWSNAADAVQHAIAWGVANANANTLVSAAAQADQAETVRAFEIAEGER